ncbi:hypothetical protein KY285_037258 [Solanum tuberosum]|nr:hypothetical protein KY285_037258 [Solanum tuberosum]
MDLGPKGVNLDNDVIILFIMSHSFTITILTVARPTIRGGNVETSFSSATVKLVNPLGAILGWTILLLQNDREPAGPYLYGVLFMSLIFYAFSILMLIRPVNTDMGLMYFMCALSIGISVRDHKKSVIVAAEVARVNDNVEVVVVADRVEAVEGVDDAIEEADRVDGEVAADRVEAVEGEAGHVDGEVVADRAEAVNFFDAIEEVVEGVEEANDDEKDDDVGKGWWWWWWLW